MVIFRLSSVSLIRVASILSVLIGALYMPSFFHTPSIIAGLGHEITDEELAVKLWAAYSVYGGVGIFAGSFLMRTSRSVLFKRLVWGLALFSILLLVAAQLPPLFWWLYVGSAFFTWSSGIGLSVHLLMLVIAFWGGYAMIQSWDRRSYDTYADRRR
ncbi:hypothetical protein D7Z26_19775 [Cohnella endophytica]|uniref:Uncharacterized protein n=1 Tax=Cohnella endophytica TaxID=2419778 RepID=A0A494XH46_9BACL|nr:hypothetical protein [Cohnella endophytica]RKP50055.1 hypothetical protein D7Z26_19775 [Cohnella endophytica]